MKLFTRLFFLVLFTNSLFGQKLVSFEYLNSQAASGLVFPGLTPTFDQDYYKVLYKTANAIGEEHVASGLVCVPKSDTPTSFPLACYQHGTVDGREDVPSNEAGGHLLAVIFASYGYVVCTPDFVGLGDSPGVHPYVHAATEASAGLDLMHAAREIIDMLDDVSLNDQVFVTGYSQGGHAAMALHRDLELNHSADFQVTASAPMSGPYSISEKMRDFTLGDRPYGTVSYLPWLVMGYQAAYPDELAGITLEDVFKPEYIADIKLFKDETITRTELNDRMSQILRDSVGDVIPKFCIKDEVVDILYNDPDHPLSVALADNDTYDWAPTAPTNLYYCKGDDQVTYENAILAEEVMTANGSTSVKAVRKDNDIFFADHGACVLPASIDAINWFGTFANVSSTTDYIYEEGIDVRYYDNILSIDMTDTDIAQADMIIYDLSGRAMHTAIVQKGLSEHELYDLNTGFYFVVLTDGQRILNSTKVFKN